MELSKRLKSVADFIDSEVEVLADIGSDHAYLPIYLIHKNKIHKAIAGEVIPGPFEHAVTEVKNAGYEDVIDVRLGDGLEVIQDSDTVDAITICGMGGTLITRILNDGYNQGIISGNEQLILQANINEYTLRTWLMNHNYKIDQETVVEDNKRFYEIIVASKSETKQNYSEFELKYGLYLPNNKTIDFKGKWEEQLDKLDYIYNEVKKSEEPQENKLTELETEINEIKEMLTNGND